MKGGIVSYVHRCHNGLCSPEKFFPTKIATGAGGITEEKGLTTYDFVGTSFFKKMMEQEVEIIIVADHFKFSRNVLVQVIPFRKIAKIVTDQGIEAKYVEVFRKHNIEYTLA